MLETDRLILREMTIEDVYDLLHIFSDPMVMQSFDSAPFDLSDMQRWVQRNLAHQAQYGYGLYSVILKDEGTLVGDCGLEHMNVDGQEEVEIGYDIRSEYWGRGLATEAALAVLDFAVHDLGLSRLVSLIRPGNLASRRVAEKVGMTREKEVVRGGQIYSVYVYSQEEMRDARDSP